MTGDQHAQRTRSWDGTLRHRGCGGSFAISVARRGKDRFELCKRKGVAELSVLADLRRVYEVVARPVWDKSPDLVLLETLPSSRESFIESAAYGSWNAVMNSVKPHVSRSGFRFKESDIEEIKVLTDQLFWRIKKSKPTFDMPTRLEQYARIRASSEAHARQFGSQASPTTFPARLVDIDTDDD